MDDKDVEHLEGEWFCRECQSKRDHVMLPFYVRAKSFI